MKWCQLMNDLEHQHGVALMDWVKLNIGRWPCLNLFYHIPNGGPRSKAAAGKLKAEGVKAGVSDYHLPVAFGGYIGLWIELKTESKNSRPTRDQIEWQERCRMYGHRAEIAVGWVEAAAIIRDYLTLKSDG